MKQKKKKEKKKREFSLLTMEPQEKYDTACVAGRLN